MKAEKNPEYLAATASAVTEFRDAFTELIELYTPWGRLGRGMAPPVVPREGSDPAEIQRRTAKVATAAGRAFEAPTLTNVLIEVEGHSAPLDPIAAWLIVTQPRSPLDPEDVLAACDSMLGRLEAMTARAEAEAPPRVGVAAMHPLIWNAARRLWDDGHVRQAVSIACEALIAQVKAVTGRKDIPDTSLWQQAFSKDAPEVGKPRLRWPGEPSDQTVKTMNEGLRQYAPGVQMLIRNPATHTTADMTEQEGLERLAALSLLARWVDECKVEVAE